MVEFYEEVRPAPALPGGGGRGWAAFVESTRCLALVPPGSAGPKVTLGSYPLDQEIREAGDRGGAPGLQPGDLRHLHHEGAAGLLARECPAPACPRAPGHGEGERTLWRVHGRLCLPQPFSKSAIEHVQGHLVKRQVPPDLFQVCADLIPHRLPAQPGSPSAQVKEPDQLPLAVTNLCLPPLAVHRGDLSEPPRGCVPEIHREVRARCMRERGGGTPS